MDEIDKRILRIMELLIFLKKTESQASFARSIDIVDRQTISNIKKGSHHFTAAHIYKICLVYAVNANCIFGFENTVFNNDATTVMTGV